MPIHDYLFEVSQKTADVSVLRFLGPGGSLIGQRELEKAAIERFIDEVERDYAVASPNLTGLGRRLYNWLDGPTERWLERACDAARGLAVHVDVADRLRHLPWELLFSMERGGFLCANPHRPFTPVRRVSLEQNDARQANRPLRVLFMASSPEDVHPVLDFDGEERMILSATRGQPIELTVEESGSLAGLGPLVRSFEAGHYDVVHLTGHADVRDGKPHFLLENDLGLAEEAAAEDIARAFSGRWPRLLFLSGCKTGEAADQGRLPSLCEALVKAGAPAVLGWALPVGDISASVAAAALYEQLGAGTRLDEAVARARQQLLEKKSGYWHLLRLYGNATPLAEPVTPLLTPGRQRLTVREAAAEFLDAGAKVEVCPRALFVGRRRPLQRCLRVLKSREGEPHYAEGVLLHGAGGLGKSSAAARLCERLPGYRRLVWVGRVESKELIRVLSDRAEDAETARIFNSPGLTLAQQVRLILSDPLAAKPSLFVFDDFEHSLDLRPEGAVLKPEALEVLGAVLRGIRETASECRAIVTSRYTFPLPGPASLYLEGLESARGADLTKKTELLTALKAASKPLRERALSLAAGNFRLLERLDKLLAHPGTDPAPILAAMEQVTAEFREEILLRELLRQQTPECRKLLARLSVCDLPVDQGAVEAINGAEPVQPHLGHAVAVGLAESGKEPATGAPRYYVSGLVKPLVEAEIPPEERLAACGRAAAYLFSVFQQAQSATDIELLEIHRLALLAREPAIAIGVGRTIAWTWINRHRYREAQALCEATLTLVEDHRILHVLARCERVLGDTIRAREHYEQAFALCPEGADPKDQVSAKERSAILHNLAALLAQCGEIPRALGLWEESLRLDEQIGDVQGKAATLHDMASVIAQQGDIPRALKLWEESLRLKEQIGYVQGKAATLHEIAWVIAQQGDIPRTLRLLEESLRLHERIGNVQGKAATTHAMASVVAQQGDVPRAMELWEDSLRLIEQIGDVQGKAATLHEMASVIAQQGDIPRALGLWEESLRLHEQIGDVRGKAATLSNMAWAAGRQGDAERERWLNLEAAKALAAVRAWLDLVTVLNNLGVSEGSGGVWFLAQAAWLALRISTPVDEAVMLFAHLFERVPPADRAAPLLATTAMFYAQVRAQGHPEAEKLRRLAGGMLGACMEARNIEPERWQDWVRSEGLDDPSHFLPALEQALEAMVGDDGWMFDRGLLPRLQFQGPASQEPD